MTGPTGGTTAPIPAGGSTAPILEVFASYQGEGLFVGEPETFVRLGGCPLRCRYCDTPHSWAVPPRDDEAPGDVGDEGPTWLTPFGTMLRVAEAELDPRRPIAVTGGEPTIWPDFLLGLADVAGDRPLRLETAGQDPDALAAVLPRFDHLSLDLKLWADLAPPAAPGLPSDRTDWDALRGRQLALALEHVDRGGTVALKLVVTPGTDPARFDPLLDDLARLAPDLPLFLAPASPREPGPYDLDPVDGVAARALERDLAPRVLPQLHRALGVR